MALLKNAVVRGGTVLFLAFAFFNALNFLFQFSMARLLTIAEYGVLATLFSLFYISGVFTESLQNTLTKYCSIEQNDGKIKNLMRRSLKKILKFLPLIILGCVVLALLLKYLLKIPFVMLLMTLLLVLFSFFVYFNRGILQGKKKFRSLSLNLMTESGLKLVIASVFVFMGLGVLGSLAAVFVALLIAFILSFYSIKEIIHAKESTAELSDFKISSRAVFFVTSCVIVFYSLDIFIARIVFDPKIAGFYAIASVISKAVFWGTVPISKALLPIASEENIKKDSSQSFFTALKLLSLLIVLSLIASYAFPELLVRIFSGKYITESASILFYLALSVSLLAFTNLFLIRKISLKKINKPYYYIIFILLEVVLLFYFSKNLIQFSLAYLTSSAIFLWGSIFLSEK